MDTLRETKIAKLDLCALMFRLKINVKRPEIERVKKKAMKNWTGKETNSIVYRKQQVLWLDVCTEQANKKRPEWAQERDIAMQLAPAVH